MKDTALWGWVFFFSDCHGSGELEITALSKVLQVVIEVYQAGAPPVVYNVRGIPRKLPM